MQYDLSTLSYNCTHNPYNKLKYKHKNKMQQINTPQPDLRQRSSEDNNVEKDLNIYLESTNIIKMIREINEPFTQHTQLMTRLEFKQPDIITQVLQKLPQSLQYFKDTYSAAEHFIERAKQMEKIITFKNWKLLPDLLFC